MRVVFLDIDGVLNSEAYLRTIDEQHRQLGHASPGVLNTCECYWLKHQIDRDAVARLNRIVTETEARVVVSSSWRKLLDPPELHRILVGHGLVAEIVGETPDWYRDPEMLTTFGYVDRRLRGYEIDLWLRRHPEVECFVILDDGSDMVMHQDRLVQTNSQEGLLDLHADLAIRMMLPSPASPVSLTTAQEAAPVTPSPSPLDRSGDPPDEP